MNLIVELVVIASGTAISYGIGHSSGWIYLANRKGMENRSMLGRLKLVINTMDFLNTCYQKPPLSEQSCSAPHLKHFR